MPNHIQCYGFASRHSNENIVLYYKNIKDRKMYIFTPFTVSLMFAKIILKTWFFYLHLFSYSLLLQHFLNFFFLVIYILFVWKLPLVQNFQKKVQQFCWEEPTRTLTAAIIITVLQSSHDQSLKGDIDITKSTEKNQNRLFSFF